MIPTGTPSSNAVTTAAVRWIPTTTNQALLFNNAATMPSVSATDYENVNGVGSNNGTELNQLNIAPVLATTMTIGNFICAQSTSPGSTYTRTNTLRGSATTTLASQTPVCQISNSTTMTIGGAASTPANQDTTHTYQPTSGYYLDVMTVPSTTLPGLTWWKTGMTVTVP
jgi:hypothetical protein